jgi:LemA protein
MKTGIIVAVVVVILILIFGGGLISTRNQLVTEKTAVQTQWSQVDVALQRRADLIPNLVETVKGYAKQERTVFGDIANARAALGGAQTPQQKMAANAQLSGALSHLLVVVENYPDLKSNEEFRQLMYELAGTENRINVERRKYNEAVQKYNTDLQLFPKNLVAGMFNFTAAPYFQADVSARSVPKVTF